MVEGGRETKKRDKGKKKAEKNVRERGWRLLGYKGENVLRKSKVDRKKGKVSKFRRGLAEGREMVENKEDKKFLRGGEEEGAEESRKRKWMGR